MVGIAWRSFAAAAAFFLVGVFIDLDHLVEYTYAYGLKGFNRRKFFHAAYNHYYPRFFLMGHSWELCLLLWAAALTVLPHPVGTALALGYTIHLAADNYINPVSPFAYFIFFRIFHGFRPEALFSEEKLKKRSGYWKKRMEPGGEI